MIEERDIVDQEIYYHHFSAVLSSYGFHVPEKGGVAASSVFCSHERRKRKRRGREGKKKKEEKRERGREGVVVRWSFFECVIRGTWDRG